jgi:hypothetical protein
MCNAVSKKLATEMMLAVQSTTAAAMPLCPQEMPRHLSHWINERWCIQVPQTINPTIKFLNTQTLFPTGASIFRCCATLDGRQGFSQRSIL